MATPLEKRRRRRPSSSSRCIVRRATTERNTAMNGRLDIKEVVGDMGNHRVNSGEALSIIEWLSGDECHSADEIGLIAGLGRRLQALGLPIDRLTLHLMTLHPEFVGRTIAWSPKEPVEVHDREHGAMAAFADSPLRKVMETREALTVSADDGERWDNIDVFSGRGLNQLMIVPLCNADGPVSAAAFGTKRPNGFSYSDSQAIERILPALRNACELRLLRQAELSLLDTYIGPVTAQRVLAQKIRQNDIESMDAALLFCGLKDFTALSNRLSSTQVLRLLNAYFDKVVSAISQRGGEVLKFTGDTVLASFPSYDQRAACRAALASAAAILEQVDQSDFEGVAIRAEIGLHFGEVSYGNVGFGRQTDFTLIGPDVNFVCSIQAACRQLTMPLLMSENFRERGQMAEATPLGLHDFAGFDRQFELFASGRCP
jgi:adenylate cyclase